MLRSGDAESSELNVLAALTPEMMLFDMGGVPIGVLTRGALPGKSV